MTSRYSRGDPYFDVRPSEIIFDERGRVIGEVYVTAESLLPRREREWSLQAERKRKKKRTKKF